MQSFIELDALPDDSKRNYTLDVTFTASTATPVWLSDVVTVVVAGTGLAINRSRVRLLAALLLGEALGKLFTHICLYHQAFLCSRPYTGALSDDAI